MNIEQMKDIKQGIKDKVYMALNTTSTADHNKEVVYYLALGYQPKEAYKKVDKAQYTVTKSMGAKYKDLIQACRVEISRLWLEQGVTEADPEQGIFLDATTTKDHIISKISVESMKEKVAALTPTYYQMLLDTVADPNEKPNTRMSAWKGLQEFVKGTEKGELVGSEDKPEEKQPEHKPFKFEYNVEELDINDL